MKENGNNIDKKYLSLKIVTIASLFVSVTLLIVLLVILNKGNTEANKPKPEGSGVTLGVIDNELIENKTNSDTDIQEEISKTNTDNQFIIFIDTRIECESDGYFEPMIQNSENNHYACWVEIVDNGETIYSSDVVQPGYKIEHDILENTLIKGKHDCQAIFHIISGDTKESEEINNISVNIAFIQK